MHQALYRKYRPTTFDDVVGQDHISSVLAWEVANHKVNHAYVFCGSAGTGKTSCAKILAKAVNCQNPRNGNPCNCCPSCKQIDAGASVEVLEMDAASNTGVDYIREIREEVIFTPSEQGTKVYIIDEVHMLSEGAFNALLKTLEEPPKNVIFVLATTEIQDIPATILSRCQRFDFKRLTSVDIVNRLNYIAKQECLSLEPEAALLIAHLAQGGMRDAISLFELCIDRAGTITTDNVRAAAGIVGRETVIETVESIARHDAKRIFEILADIYRSSKDVTVFIADIISFYRDMLVQKVMRITSLDGLNRDILDVSSGELSDISRLSELFTREKLLYHIKLLEETYVSMNKSEIKRTSAEITLSRLALNKYDTSLEALEARIAELEISGVKPASPAFSEIPKTENTPPSPEPPKDTKKKEDQPKTLTAVKPKETEPLAEWVDIVDQYSSKEPSRAPFLKNSSAYFDEQNAKLIVYVGDAFGKMMLDNAKATDSILPIAVRMGIAARTCEIVISATKIVKKDPLDDLL